MNNKTITGIKILLLILVFNLPVIVKAQHDTLKLVCPLNDAIVIPPSKNSIKYDLSDVCLVLTSIADSIVKACINAQVTNTEMDEEGKYGVVLFAKINKRDYYFWYTGLSMMSVRKSENVKAGQPVGFINPGDEIKLMMFNFETPVDPARYLDCKGSPKEK